MRATYSLVVPDDALVSLTLIGTVKEFRELRECLKEQYPGWTFARMLRQAIDEAKRSHSAEHEAQTL